MTDNLPALPGIDREAVLKYLNLPPRAVATQALLLICERYGLDPLMKHVVLIDGKPYVTRDGYLHIAHTSGVLDGIEVVDEGESETHHTAKVAVYRKDMSKPFAYTGRYPKSGGNQKYGPEMAVKTAEVMALRRAFDVTGVGAADERWDDANDAAVTTAPPLPEGWASQEVMDAALLELADAIEEIEDEGGRMAVRSNLRAFRKANGIPSLMTPDQLAQLWGEFSRLTDQPPADPETGEIKPEEDLSRPFTDDEPEQGALV